MDDAVWAQMLDEDEDWDIPEFDLNVLMDREEQAVRQMDLRLTNYHR